ncbi:MAG: redoxin domain-containing protein [Nocardioidaceae bacterium]
MTLLGPGDTFPHLEVHLVGGETLDLPGALVGRFGVVLLNRGSWCPFCTAQLRGFQRANQALEEVGASLVSLSVDDEATTRDLVEHNKLTFPIGHSADAHAIAVLTGAFVNPAPVYIQATGFVLDPEGRVITSVYSSGAIGRLTAEDTLGFIRHVKGGA